MNMWEKKETFYPLKFSTKETKQKLMAKHLLSDDKESTEALTP